MTTLLTGSDFVYQGSFALPTGKFPTTATDGSHQFGSAYDGYPDPIGFNPANNSLFLKGGLGDAPDPNLVAEAAIPTLVKPKTADVTLLNRATVLQNFGDVSGGLADQAKAGAVNPRIGSVYPLDNKYYWTAYGPYNSDNVVPSVSHGRSDQSLSTPNAQGMYTLGDGVMPAGAKGGFITGIPSAYQSAFGGFTHCSGLNGQSIVIRVVAQ